MPSKHTLPPPSRRDVLLAGAASALALAGGAARAADDFPNRPVRLIVPFPPAAATDVIGRMLAKSMSEHLGQPIVVENIGGAAAIIGAETLAKAKPDGYTLMYSAASVHVINPAIYAKLPYDPLGSFTMIAPVARSPFALVVLASAPFKTAQELIAYAKANPGKLSYGSAGVGSTGNQFGEMLKHATGTSILHVPYKGANQATTDFQAGLVDILFSYLGSVLPNAKAGKYRLLAVGSPQRIAMIADVPTAAEITGQADFDADTWTALVGPAGLPAPIVERLQQATAHAVRQNRDYFENNGYTPMEGTSKDITGLARRQLNTLTPLLAKLMDRAG